MQFLEVGDKKVLEGAQMILNLRGLMKGLEGSPLQL